MQPNCILLVEDDFVDAALIIKGVQRYKIRNLLIHVTDGLDALTILRNKDSYAFQGISYIVLLDMHLPHMNGLEFLQAVRRADNVRQHIIFALIPSEFDRAILAPYSDQLAGYIMKDNLGYDFLKVLPLLMPMLQ